MPYPAGGNIGADLVAKSPADGYTILMGAVATHAINPTLYASIPYDAVRDFSPITQVASTPNVLVVNPAVPAANLREFIAYAKANPGKLNFDNLASSLGQMRAGKVRALAVTTAKRTPLAPDLPTIAEAGLPGFDISTWFGVFAPAGTPREALDRLHAQLTRALGAPDVREKMLNLGAEPVGNRPEEFAAYIRAEAEKYARVIKASGARAD